MSVDKTMPILIVDENETMIRITGFLLRQLGFSRISEAADGDIALNMLRRKTYSLIIADLNMQNITGLQLLKSVRTDANLKNIPFIMIDSKESPENLTRMKEAGASSLIAKPFNAETLRSKLQTVIGSF